MSERKPVRFAVLHETVGVPTGAGAKMVNLKGTLNPNDVEGKKVGLKLWATETYLEASVYGTIARFPITNCKVLVMEDEEPAK